jgi:hypothetical protein
LAFSYSLRPSPNQRRRIAAYEATFLRRPASLGRTRGASAKVAPVPEARRSRTDKRPHRRRSLGNARIRANHSPHPSHNNGANNTTKEFQVTELSNVAILTALIQCQSIQQLTCSPACQY